MKDAYLHARKVKAVILKESKIRLGAFMFFVFDRTVSGFEGIGLGDVEHGF